MPAGRAGRLDLGSLAGGARSAGHLTRCATTPSQQPSDDKKPWVQVLSWKPRAFVYHHFLSDAEAAHIIKLAAPQASAASHPL
ncbi:uncharacterized protein HaLaN_24493 [Haematococcus lacustris]|uniref:Uncharacterized protein n=1 Tax=Haematococcus lacustris TaxID=44745 RepID=A0A6A0A2I7_HAELA|nr:uncharacterized protein HaLaN_24493 [Haematococcus lacustris]